MEKFNTLHYCSEEVNEKMYSVRILTNLLILAEGFHLLSMLLASVVHRGMTKDVNG
jgi:hypothetical protein